jgi:hypothetical protein
MSGWDDDGSEEEAMMHRQLERRQREELLERREQELQLEQENQRAHEAKMDCAEDMYEALKAYEKLDDFHANCEECDGLEQPETCAKCFPLADDARLKMRAAIEKAEERS